MNKPRANFVYPDWPAPATVRALTSTREGGVSLPPYASFNLARHVGDDPRHVDQNRSLLLQQLDLPGEPRWLEQVHGTALLNLDQNGTRNEADGSFSRLANRVCAVMTADCMPVLMCSSAGDRVAALHAGWRGLAAGILRKGVAAMAVEESQLLVWLGPAIGSKNFEVGEEVYRAFITQFSGAEKAFESAGAGHWYADLYLLARMQLRSLGVDQVFGGEFCTYTDTQRFYSYRRNGATGRMASLIWLQGGAGD
ncbi:MAG: peptidoglycan editing factor PgeF [Acidiferrobacterales bacterium]